MRKNNLKDEERAKSFINNLGNGKSFIEIERENDILEELSGLDTTNLEEIRKYKMKLIRLKRDIEIFLSRKEIPCDCFRGYICKRCDILNRLKALQENKL